MSSETGTLYVLTCFNTNHHRNRTSQCVLPDYLTYSPSMTTQTTQSAETKTQRTLPDIIPEFRNERMPLKPLQPPYTTVRYVEHKVIHRYMNKSTTE